MNSKVIILGTAHRRREPGKQSPDGRLLEYLYSREIVSGVSERLQSMGHRVCIDMTAHDLPRDMLVPSSTLERQRELALRTNYVNEVCRQEGAQNVLYVSMHVNAADSDGRWHKANGWSVFVCPKCSQHSKVLADCLVDAALNHGLKVRQPLPSQKYWEKQLYVLRHTLCPAVLTENLFQDNLDDVEFLLSDEGRSVIERIHVAGIINYINRQNA